MRITRESLSEDTQVLWDDVYEAEFHFIDAKRALRASIEEELQIGKIVLNWEAKSVTAIARPKSTNWRQFWDVVLSLLVLAQFIALGWLLLTIA